MKLRWIGLALGTLLAMGAALSLPSCGHDQKLVALQITPSTFTFLTPDLTATEQYTAIATYIHPPATMDVTSKATWAVDDGIVSINAGLVSPLGGCGGGDISASMPEGTGGSQNIVLAYATVTVNNPDDPICPGGGTEGLLTVAVNPAAGGTVTSLTGGISCPSLCFAEFAVGASVGLTATPAQGYSFVNWTGCTAFQGNSCSVAIPVGGAGVSATFTAD
jgi:hypothetical protein